MKKILLSAGDLCKKAGDLYNSLIQARLKARILIENFDEPTAYEAQLADGHDRALTFYKSVLDLSKNNYEDNISDYNVSCHIIEIYIEENDITNCLSSADKALDLAKTLPECGTAQIYELIGTLYFNNQDNDLAILNYEKALDILGKHNPRSCVGPCGGSYLRAEVMLYLALVYNNKKDKKKSKKILDEVEKIIKDRNYSEIKKQLEMVRTQIGKKQR